MNSSLEIRDGNNDDAAAVEAERDVRAVGGDDHVDDFRVDDVEAEFYCGFRSDDDVDLVAVVHWRRRRGRNFSSLKIIIIIIVRHAHHHSTEGIICGWRD